MFRIVLSILSLVTGAEVVASAEIAVADSAGIFVYCRPMADPLTVTETITTSHSPAEAQGRLASHFGGKVTENTPGTLVATSGSKLAIRLLGAYLIPAAWMPIKTAVEFTESGGGCQANVTCTDNFGFGIRAGIRGRYQRALEAKLAEVRSALGS